MNQMEIIPGIGDIEPKEISEIINHHMFALSADYSKMYKEDPKTFLTCFLKFESFRMACAFIISSFKYVGAFEECKASGKDFSEYADKQMVAAKWKRVLAEILLIIYCLLN